MPTPNERKALWFLAIVALSGTAVRLTRSSLPPPTSAQGEALARQLERVDSVRAARRDESARSRQRRTTARQRKSADAPSPPSPTRVEAPSSDESSAAGARDVPRIVDLDRATAEEIESLPGIGPALAKRIVANRDSVGAFGAIDALCDVRGVGPKLAERLRPLVTFTGPRRPLSDTCGGPARAPRKRRGSTAVNHAKSF